MNTQVGKSIGIALLLAAGLLAAFFAMGVFSANSVGADVSSGAMVELSDYSFGATNVTMTATFQVTVPGDPLADGKEPGASDDGTQNVTITLGNEFGVYSTTSPGVVESIKQGGKNVGTIPGNTTKEKRITIDIDAAAAEITPAVAARGPVVKNMDVIVVISGITNPSAVGGHHTIELSQSGQKDADGKDTSIKVVAAFPDATADLSSQEPGAAVQITLHAGAGANGSDDTDLGILPNQDITVELKGFGMPTTIADSAIDIVSKTDMDDKDNTGFRGSPANVLVNGSKITMTVPNVNAAGSNQMKAVTGDYSIKIKQSAGITNPASAGSKTITLQENAPDGAKKAATATIYRVIKLSATSGTRGTKTTATFKGFANGTATVNLNGAKLDEVTIADNVGTLEIDTTSTKFLANRTDGNEITATDASGTEQDVSANFTISPKVELDPAETSVSKNVTVKLSDWPISNPITEVKIGATDATPTTAQSTATDGKAEFMVQVPATVNRGTQTVKVTGTKGTLESAPSATASLKIGVLSLDIQPSTAVPGQEITIQASGFKSGDEIEEVQIGNQPASVDATANSGGNIVITLKIPSPDTTGAIAIGDGTKTVTVKTKGGSGRIAEGSIEIPEAAITLSPDNSRRGTTVNASGTGFPSGDLVQVQYDNSGVFVTVAAGSADASGAVSIDFVVPSYARIGTKHDVKAASVGIYKGVTAEATHTTPDAVLTLEPQQAVSGTNMTISGMNFPAFATVSVMKIGTIDVRPVPAPSTSVDGDFESTVLVPQLEIGNQTVTITVSSTNITTFLEIVTETAVAVTDPAELFAELGARLLRVWEFDNATQQWSFYDPRPDRADFNSLTEVSSGDIATIIISSGDPIEFQGSNLYSGTNQIVLK